ncbi:hypothetical protein GRD74_15865 (plasmid) [Clavibacter michiganensis subsp. michiganensis]|nr:hypothetical protein GRD74_15865 [Clavibacter michiganensis subsp. michiganensis]
MLRYVMRVRAELDGPSTFWFYANARNELGQRIWLQGEDSLSSTAADIGGPLELGAFGADRLPGSGSGAAIEGLVYGGAVSDVDRALVRPQHVREPGDVQAAIGGGRREPRRQPLVQLRLVRGAVDGLKVVDVGRELLAAARSSCPSRRVN